jgi:hypothetical protein
MLIFIHFSLFGVKLQLFHEYFVFSYPSPIPGLHYFNVLSILFNFVHLTLNSNLKIAALIDDYVADNWEVGNEFECLSSEYIFDLEPFF